MNKPTIDQLLSNEVEWKILDKMIHNWRGLSRDTLQASIDALWYKCTPSTPVKKYTCRICKNETLLQKGVDQYCPNCKDKTVIWWTEI